MTHGVLTIEAIVGLTGLAMLIAALCLSIAVPLLRRRQKKVK
jgi:hypothetical protein